MIHPRTLTRIARSVVVQALLDYAKAHKTLNRPTASPAAKAAAADTQDEIREFFAEGRDNSWLDQSEFNLEWLCAKFETFASDPAALEAATKLRFACP